jgi:hypothetical protein
MARGVAQVTVVQGVPSPDSTERLLMADDFYDHRAIEVECHVRAQGPQAVSGLPPARVPAGVLHSLRLPSAIPESVATYVKRRRPSVRIDQGVFKRSADTPWVLQWTSALLYFMGSGLLRVCGCLRKHIYREVQNAS